MELLIPSGAEHTKAGTPDYMAPELFQDEGLATTKSDVWAFGILIIELMTGRA